jgi:hypothetical protein
MPVYAIVEVIEGYFKLLVKADGLGLAALFSNLIITLFILKQVLLHFHLIYHVLEPL